MYLNLKEALSPLSIELVSNHRRRSFAIESNLRTKHCNPCASWNIDSDTCMIHITLPYTPNNRLRLLAAITSNPPNHRFPLTPGACQPLDLLSIQRQIDVDIRKIPSLIRTWTLSPSFHIHENCNRSWPRIRNYIGGSEVSGLGIFFPTSVDCLIEPS